MDGRDAALPEAPDATRRRSLATAVIVVATCLLACIVSWPGFATQDTTIVTSDALRGIFTDYHPLLNALLLRALAVPFDSYGPYTLFQIATCGLLFHRSLVLVARDSVRTWPTLLSVLLWAFSASTVLFLGIIWKDVLTAYSMLYAAALLYSLRSMPDWRPTRLDAVLFGVALVLLTNLRHGMALNFLVLPVLFGVRRVLTERRLAVPFAVAIAAFLLLASLVRNDEAHYAMLKVQAVSQPLLGIASRDRYTSDDHSYDSALLLDVFGPDFRQQYKPDTFSNTVVLKDKASLDRAYRAIVLRTPRICLLNLADCLAGRIEMLLSTLQPSAGGTTFYELGAAGDCLHKYGMTPDYCAILSRFSTSERLAIGDQLRDWLVGRFVTDPGLVRNLLVWNLFPALALLVLVLVLHRSGSPQWLVAVYFATQMAVPFAASMAMDFRYYYFLALYFFVFLPKLLASARVPARPAPASRDLNGR